MEVEYSADLDHLMIEHHSDIKIPENLLKVDDLSETYVIAEKMSSKTAQFTQIQTTRS